MNVQHRGMILSVATVSFFVVPALGSEYTIVDLGTLGGDVTIAVGISESGPVVGEARETDGVFHAFLWENGIMTDLWLLPGYDHSEAWAINASGQVVGSSWTDAPAQHAFLITPSDTDGDGVADLWYRRDPCDPCDPNNGLMIDLGTLGGPSGNDTSYARDINDDGQVVGQSTVAAGPSRDNRSYIWEDLNGNGQSDPGEMLDLGTPSEGGAEGINASGQVVGGMGYPASPYVWENWVTTTLQLLPGHTNGWAYDINAGGQVVGRCRTSGDIQQACLWENGTVTELETPGGWTESNAYAINDAGQVVGNLDLNQAACLWQDGGVYELNDLVDPNSGWDLRAARDINNAGWIVGDGVDPNGEYHAYLLVPPLALTIKKRRPSWGNVRLDPEPNDPNLPQYSYGTEVTLTAEPNEGKIFKKWKIWDLTHPNDSDYPIADTNAVLHLTIDRYWKVKAIFKCGGGGVESLLPIMLGVLGLCAVVRRKR